VAVKKDNNSQQVRGVRTILRVLDILEVLEEFPGGLTLAEIAVKINIPKSTVHRILGVLHDRQYIRGSSTNGKYLLGYQILSLAKVCVSGIDLLREAHPLLEVINREFNETVILGVLDQNRHCVIYLDKIDTSHSLRLVSHIGERIPVHCTALGKAILSQFNEEELRIILADYELRKFTGNTITDLEELIKELREINRIGFAIDRMEYKPHVSCVAVPICGFQGRSIAAISVSIPTARFSQDRQELIIQKVVDSAHSINEMLSLTKTQEAW